MLISDLGDPFTWVFLLVILAIALFVGMGVIAVIAELREKGRRRVIARHEMEKAKMEGRELEYRYFQDLTSRDLRGWDG